MLQFLAPSRVSSSNGADTPVEGVEWRTGSPSHPNINQVFVRSFVFHPDLLIRIDYVRKGFNTQAVVGFSSY